MGGGEVVCVAFNVCIAVSKESQQEFLNLTHKHQKKKEESLKKKKIGKLLGERERETRQNRIPSAFRFFFFFFRFDLNGRLISFRHIQKERKSRLSLLSILCFFIF